MIVKITMTLGSSVSDTLEIWTSPDNINWTQWGVASKEDLIEGFLIVTTICCLYYKVVDPVGPCEGTEKIFSCL